MKTIITLLSFLIFNSSFFISSAQVLCIQCYNQNARVLTDTNNLIVNGGFENTTCAVGTPSFCPNSFGYRCNIANWTCTGGGVRTYAQIFDSSYTTIVEGAKACFFGNYFCNPCSAIYSDSSCFHQVGCEVVGIQSGYPVNFNSGYGGDTGVILSQTVSGLTVGANYELEFWAGGGDVYNNSTLFRGDGIFAVDVGFGNIFLRDPSTHFDSGIGRRFIIIFTADSTSHIIKFTDWGHINDSANDLTHTELILDDVRLFLSPHHGSENPCINSINELSKNAASVFPNPVTNQLTVTTNTSSEIIIYDVASRKLLQQKFTGSVSLNVENLAKGIYLYEVRDGDGVVKQGKMVKE